MLDDLRMRAGAMGMRVHSVSVRLPRPHWSRSALTAHLGRLSEGVLTPQNGLGTVPIPILGGSDMEVEAVGRVPSFMLPGAPMAKAIRWSFLRHLLERARQGTH